MKTTANTGWNFVRCMTGLLLLSSAMLKAYSPTTAIVLTTAYVAPAWVTTAIVQAEVILSVALLANLSPTLIRGVAVGFFSVFSVFSLYRGFIGAESCGCFGAVKVDPWVTSGLDVLVLCSLVFCRPASRGLDLARMPRARAALLVLLLGGVVISGFVLRGVGGSRSSGSLNGAAGGPAIIDPEGWIGGPFPLGSYINPRREVSSGKWIVLLYHHGCRKCQAALPQYEALASDGAAVLLIEAPPYGPNHPHQAGSPLYVRLTDEQEWFVQAPVEIKIANGIVTAASLDLPSIHGVSR